MTERMLAFLSCAAATLASLAADNGDALAILHAKHA